MPIDLTSFLFPNSREEAARIAGQRAEQQAVRSAAGAAQTRGAVNPAALARTGAMAQSDQRAANAGNIAAAQSADQQAMGQAITGLIGTGLSTVGSLGALGMGGGAAAPAMGAGGGVPGAVTQQLTSGTAQPTSLTPEQELEAALARLGLGRQLSQPY